MIERSEVYRIIDTERDYQIRETADPNRPDMVDNLHVGDTILAIQHNLDKARAAWYQGFVPHQEAMEYLRKVAGLCVQVMEKHGAPERK